MKMPALYLGSRVHDFATIAATMRTNKQSQITLQKHIGLPTAHPSNKTTAVRSVPLLAHDAQGWLR